MEDELGNELAMEEAAEVRMQCLGFSPARSAARCSVRCAVTSACECGLCGLNTLALDGLQEELANKVEAQREAFIAAAEDASDPSALLDASVILTMVEGTVRYRAE